LIQKVPVRTGKNRWKRDSINYNIRKFRIGSD